MLVSKIKTFAVVAGWLALAFIAFVTLSPIQDRPTFLHPQAERFAAAAAVEAARAADVVVLAIGTPGDDAVPYLVHNRKCYDCRITAAPARVAAGTLVVAPQTAKRLRLSAGDLVRAVPLALGH